MANEYFKGITESDTHDEIYDKYMKVTPKEQEKLNAPKSKLYLTVADIETIQDGLQCLIQTAAELGQGFADERRVMQMGYALEEVKYKLKKRTDNEVRRDV